MLPDLLGQTNFVSATNVDLTNCDREIVHRPGLIQPHGAMLVLRPDDLAILQTSQNTPDLLGVVARNRASGMLADMLPQPQADALTDAIRDAGGKLDQRPVHLRRMAFGATGITVDAFAHRASDVLILELERTAAGQPGKQEPIQAVLAAVDALRRSSSLRAFLDVAVTEVRALTGFDRVMAYRFDEDGSGEVVAEARRDDLNPYLGQHFPASDIPAPARRLLPLSALRFLPDVNYTPVPLLPALDHPVDMSRAILRHVSTVYTDYLRNMRARATMVLPLTKGGKLWGLISCMHHSAPRHPPVEQRAAIELFSHVISSMLAAREDQDTAAYRERMNQAVATLGRQMARNLDVHQGLCHGAVTAHGWLNATGAALVTADRTVRFGLCPSDDQLRDLANWLSQRPGSVTTFATDRLPKVYPPAEAYRQVVSGLLVTQIIRTRQDFVMWFRPEATQTVNWAGDPRKPVDLGVVAGETRLTPRRSFELWQETVHGRSLPWLDCEVEAVASLHRLIADVMLLRLDRDLDRSDTELDDFSRFLQASAETGSAITGTGESRTAQPTTPRMDDLNTALLHYKRVGQTVLVTEVVDLNDVLRHAIGALSVPIAETAATIQVPDDLPIVRTDAMCLREVFSSLISNAIKYNDQSKGQRRVEIGWRNEPEQHVVYVRDNGIGIARQHLEQIFLIFRRLHGRSAYGGGTGAGLTIARRIVERLGGRLWAESDGPGTGATFWFTLQRAAIGSPMEKSPIS